MKPTGRTFTGGRRSTWSRGRQRHAGFRHPPTGPSRRLGRAGARGVGARSRSDGSRRLHGQPGHERLRAHGTRVHARRPTADHAAVGRPPRLRGRSAPDYACAHHTLEPPLLELGARAARDRRRSRLRDDAPHLPLLHVQQVRHLSREQRVEPRQPRVPLHAARHERRRPGSGGGARRQHAVAERQPQRRRPPVRQGRLPLRQRRRRRLRLRRRQRLRRQQRRRARPARPARARSCGSPPTGASLRTTRSAAPTARAATSTGRTDPGNKCQETFAWGLRNPFRLAFDPAARARASSSTTSARTPGRRSTSARRARTTAGTSARAPARPARRRIAERRRQA